MLFKLKSGSYAGNLPSRATISNPPEGSIRSSNLAESQKYEAVHISPEEKEALEKVEVRKTDEKTAEVGKLGRKNPEVKVGHATEITISEISPESAKKELFPTGNYDVVLTEKQQLILVPQPGGGHVPIQQTKSAPVPSKKKTAAGTQQSPTGGATRIPVTTCTTGDATGIPVTTCMTGIPACTSVSISTGAATASDNVSKTAQKTAPEKQAKTDQTPANKAEPAPTNTTTVEELKTTCTVSPSATSGKKDDTTRMPAGVQASTAINSKSSICSAVRSTKPVPSDAGSQIHAKTAKNTASPLEAQAKPVQSTSKAATEPKAKPSQAQATKSENVPVSTTGGRPLSKASTKYTSTGTTSTKATNARSSSTCTSTAVGTLGIRVAASVPQITLGGPPSPDSPLESSQDSPSGTSRATSRRQASTGGEGDSPATGSRPSGRRVPPSVGQISSKPASLSRSSSKSAVHSPPGGTVSKHGSSRAISPKPNEGTGSPRPGLLSTVSPKQGTGSKSGARTPTSPRPWSAGSRTPTSPRPVVTRASSMKIYHSPSWPHPTETRTSSMRRANSLKRTNSQKGMTSRTPVTLMTSSFRSSALATASSRSVAMATVTSQCKSGSIATTGSKSVASMVTRSTATSTSANTKSATKPVAMATKTKPASMVTSVSKPVTMVTMSCKPACAVSSTPAVATATASGTMPKHSAKVNTPSIPVAKGTKPTNQQASTMKETKRSDSPTNNTSRTLSTVPKQAQTERADNNSSSA